MLMWPASAFTSPESKPHSNTQNTHLEEVHTHEASLWIATCTVKG